MQNFLTRASIKTLKIPHSCTQVILAFPLLPVVFQNLQKKKRGETFLGSVINLVCLISENTLREIFVVHTRGWGGDCFSLLCCA